MLTQLQPLVVPNRKYCYRPLQLPLPEWHGELLRLTRSICVDLRTVTAAGCDVGTWAEVKALETLYSAQVCVFMNPYHAGFGGYTNTDPTVTDGGGGQSDAAHVASIATQCGHIRTNYIDALGGTVRTVFLDTEVFNALPNSAANAAHNDALKLKFQNVYDKIVHATTGFPNCTYISWYGLGSVWQNANGDAVTPISATDSGPGGPYPWGYRWGMDPWSVSHYDNGDVTPPYTVGASVPFIEVAGNTKMTSAPVLYRPHDYEATRQGMFKSELLYNAAGTGIWSSVARPLLPWMTLGVAMQATADTGSQPSGTVATYGPYDYDTDISYWYGIIMDDAFHATMMPAPVEIVFWEAPNNANYPKWMDHFVAFVKGAGT